MNGIKEGKVSKVEESIWKKMMEIQESEDLKKVSEERLDFSVDLSEQT